ncbi:hypothetical protein LMG6003_05955 [Achromobacter insolitus]|nr:hypothetical protein LMG6003_05955 [Achromobacter insolitus]
MKFSLSLAFSACTAGLELSSLNSQVPSLFRVRVPYCSMAAFWASVTFQVTPVMASAPLVSLVTTLPLSELMAASSVTVPPLSSLATGAVSRIWMTKSLLVDTPATSVTVTVKLSLTESSPAVWSSAPPVSW